MDILLKGAKLLVLSLVQSPLLNVYSIEMHAKKSWIAYVMYLFLGRRKR